MAIIVRKKLREYPRRVRLGIIPLYSLMSLPPLLEFDRVAVAQERVQGTAPS